ncbi:MAG: QueT transporter family protein [Oscillospiraceae bacterium]|nr:QueT transporter family protein [Oscillospiraceae bacterium]
MMKLSIRKLVAAAVIGALYAALTLVNPLAYGPIQFRFSEVLCILPFFFPASAAGLTVGCVIANIIGPYGVLDIVFGSLATLLAGICTALIGIRARKKGECGWGACITACLMPVIFNAPIVGAVIAYASVELAFWKGFVLYGAQVGLGEAGVMLVLGLPAMRYILKRPALSTLMNKAE